MKHHNAPHGNELLVGEPEAFKGFCGFGFGHSPPLLALGGFGACGFSGRADAWLLVTLTLCYKVSMHHSHRLPILPRVALGLAIAIVGVYSSVPGYAAVGRGASSIGRTQSLRAVGLRLHERKVLQQRGLALTRAGNFVSAASYLEKVVALDRALSADVPPCTLFEDHLDAQAAKETSDAISSGNIAPRKAYDWFLMRALKLFFYSDAKTLGYDQCRSWERQQRLKRKRKRWQR